jgi:hypothetical protein
MPNPNYIRRLITSYHGGGAAPSPGLTAYDFTDVNTSTAFPEMDGVGLDSYNGVLSLTGGWNGLSSPVTYDTVWTSSDGDIWTLQAAPGWTRRHIHGHGVLNGKQWIWGGDYHTGSYQKDVWSYDTINGWVQVSSDWGTGVGNRIFFSHCIHNNKMYVIGGQNANVVTPTMFTDVYSSADGVTWSKEGDLPLSYFSGGTAWSSGGVLYIAGGGRYLEPTSDNINTKVYKSIDNGANWTEVSTLPTAMQTIFPNGTVWDNKLWYLNGYEIGVGNKEGLYYSADNGVTWLQFYTNPSARHGSGICVHNNKLYIVAGNMHNDCYSIEKKAITVSSSWSAWYNALTLQKPSYDLTLAIESFMEGLLTTDSQTAAIKCLFLTAGMETDEQRFKPLISTSGDDMVAVGNDYATGLTGIRPTAVGSAFDTKWNAVDNGDGITDSDSFYGICQTTFNYESAGIAAGWISTNNAEGLLFPKYPGGDCYYSLNGTSQSTQSGVTQAMGYKVIFKDNSTHTKFREVNGTVYSSATTLETASEGRDYYLGACNFKGAVLASLTEVPQGLFIAGIQSLADHTKIQARINTFMAVRGITIS